MMDEVLQVAALGVQQGCAEILFTLGKPPVFHVDPGGQTHPINWQSYCSCANAICSPFADPTAIHI